MAPTMAWLVDTGRPSRVMAKVATAAANATVNEPARALTAPRRPRVCAAPAPPNVAPTITKTEQIAAAVANRTMRLPTAVPNTLAASLAPRDQPRNKPLER